MIGGGAEGLVGRIIAADEDRAVELALETLGHQLAAADEDIETVVEEDGLMAAGENEIAVVDGRGHRVAVDLDEGEGVGFDPEGALKPIGAEAEKIDKLRAFEGAAEGGGRHRRQGHREQMRRARGEIVETGEGGGAVTGSEPFDRDAGGFGKVDQTGHPGLAAAGNPFVDGIIRDADGAGEVGDGAELLHNEAQAASEFFFDAN